jgi:hypothetical protein
MLKTTFDAHKLTPPFVHRQSAPPAASDKASIIEKSVRLPPVHGGAKATRLTTIREITQSIIGADAPTVTNLDAMYDAASDALGAIRQHVLLTVYGIAAIEVPHPTMAADLAMVFDALAEETTARGFAFHVVFVESPKAV